MVSIEFTHTVINLTRNTSWDRYHKNTLFCNISEKKYQINITIIHITQCAIYNNIGDIYSDIELSLQSFK